MATKKTKSSKRKVTSQRRASVARRRTPAKRSSTKAKVSTSVERKGAQLLAKLWSDPEFKAYFTSNPEQAIRDQGFLLPEGIKIIIVEDTADRRHIVIPYRQSAGKIGILDDPWGIITICHCDAKSMK